MRAACPAQCRPAEVSEETRPGGAVGVLATGPSPTVPVRRGHRSGYPARLLTPSSEDADDPSFPSPRLATLLMLAAVSGCAPSITEAQLDQAAKIARAAGRSAGAATSTSTRNSATARSAPSKIVAEHLKSLGLEVRTGVAHTGVVGVLQGGKPGPGGRAARRHGRAAGHRAGGRAVQVHRDDRVPRREGRRDARLRPRRAHGDPDGRGDRRWRRCGRTCRAPSCSSSSRPRKARRTATRAARTLMLKEGVFDDSEAGRRVRPARLLGAQRRHDRLPVRVR